jgi:hypothetical protein
MKTMKWFPFGVLLLIGCTKQPDPAEKARQDNQSKIEKEVQNGAFEAAPLPLNYSTPSPSPS